MRKIDPPRESFDQLPTELTAGELKVIDLFDKELPDKWEIYVQPHLNGLCPDIVLLHPGVGVAVFEIKDWNLSAMQYYSKEDRDGRLILMARNKNSVEFSREKDNPINKILLYEKEIFELYCPRLDARAGRAVITAGLVFPFSPRGEVERVFGPFRQEHKWMRQRPQYYPIAGAEDVSSGTIEKLFPESQRCCSKIMSDDIANDLRGWLKEPFSSKQERRPLALDMDNDIQKLAATRTKGGYRRIKGPAGSGKSVVLAARAATLATEGKNTLVLSFNITLLNYLHDLAVRHKVPRQVIRSQIVFLYFHRWCKRVCIEAGRCEEYKRVWPNSSDGVESNIESKELVSLMKRLYREDAGQSMPKYDAILVDEGQDFYLSWWQTLRMALKKGGEMVLVADKTQDIYERGAAWTEETMRGAGFHGPWVELKTSYRLPPKIVPFVRKFAEEFLTGEEIDIPPDDQGELHLYPVEYPVELRWLHVREQSKVLKACKSEHRRMMTRPHYDTANTDITFLFNSTDRGRDFVRMQKEDWNLNVLHTFDEDSWVSRRQKFAFFKGSEKIKATTPHSFKGWEARLLIVLVESVWSKTDRALLYTSLTRLLRHRNGSSLTVVSCCDDLRAYAKSWPDYEEF